MNVVTIKMPQEVAAKKLEEYRAILPVKSQQVTDEDKDIMLGYQHLAAGKQILDLREVFRNCLADERGLPRFAVARADWQFSFLEWQRGFLFAHSRSWGKSGAHTYHFGLNSLPHHFQNEPGVFTKQRWFRAMVPLMPLAIRPKPTTFHKYVILFEAEWKPIAPRDPILLQKLSRGRGSLYVILAAWDLTELERSVLADRFLEGS